MLVRFEETLVDFDRALVLTTPRSAAPDRRPFLTRSFSFSPTELVHLYRYQSQLRQGELLRTSVASRRLELDLLKLQTDKKMDQYGRYLWSAATGGSDRSRQETTGLSPSAAIELVASLSASQAFSEERTASYDSAVQSALSPAYICAR